MVQAGIVSPDTPFIGEQPNKNISLCMYGDSTGLRVWNDKNDPMPIKTTNMAGLQKWEETEDYIIYLCKDATMTVVENYVTGTFQEFQERKAQIEANQEIMRSYSIEWTEQDSIDLINDINKRALMSLALKPTTLDLEETPNETQVLSSKAVPVTYECCFRIDKKSGELYIGEGYENLFTGTLKESSGYKKLSFEETNENFIYEIENVGGNSNTIYSLFVEKVFPPEEKNHYSQAYSVLKNINDESIVLSNSYMEILDVDPNSTAVLDNILLRTERNISIRYGNRNKAIGTITKFVIDKKIFLTKTESLKNKKPYVKSVMPTGKLDRISNANETTHTFLNKGDGVVIFGNGFFSLKGEKIQQLLVYNALLTEQEKQTELAKDIKLNDGYNDYFNIRRKL